MNYKKFVGKSSLKSSISSSAREAYLPEPNIDAFGLLLTFSHLIFSVEHSSKFVLVMLMQRTYLYFTQIVDYIHIYHYFGP